MKITDLEQRKLDSTRRIHVFVKGADFSLCGTANYDNTIRYKGNMSWTRLSVQHPTDDLNFCQRCGNLVRRK